MGKKVKQKDALDELLSAASPEVLRELIPRLTVFRPDVRRECLDYLKGRVAVSETLAQKSEGEIVLALWSELEPDLDELDSCGGGPRETENDVAELLDQVCEQLKSNKVSTEHRQQVLARVLAFIKSGNSGMDDLLYEVAYAACYDDGDLRRLAEAFEAMKGDWKIANARDIYRRIGDREKYLELRRGRMTYGTDYHDLATFYWESGEKDKALQVAEQGLCKGRGRMDQLRRFVADRAKAAGDREKYLTLEFEQVTDGLTLTGYKAFKKLCTPVEWQRFEPQVMARIDSAQASQQMKIRLNRREYEKVLEILVKERYPTWTGYDVEAVQIAKKLEKRFPEEILDYYRSGLGNLRVNATRKEYARRARVMAKVWHMLVEVIGDEGRWVQYATKVKEDNLRRPAFQEEFAAVVPGWREL